MTDLDFNRMIVALTDERDARVLEEIVCHLANAGDVQVLKIIRKKESELAASLVRMRDGNLVAGRWFDTEAAVSLRNKQVVLIEAELAIVQRK